MYLTSTSTLAGLDIDYADDFTWIYLGLWKSDFKNEIFFWCQGIFFHYFDYKNGCKNEFKDNNEKSWSWSRNSVSHKIDFKAVRPRNGHADSVRVNIIANLDLCRKTVGKNCLFNLKGLMRDILCVYGSAQKNSANSLFSFFCFFPKRKNVTVPRKNK